MKLGSNLRRFDRELVEKTLCQIAEIEAARVVSDDHGGISELHILSTPGKGPKQLARDVESTLAAKFGISIDHRIVSIAQIASEDSDKNSRVPDRVRIEGITTESSSSQVKIIVRLAFKQSQASGESSGSVPGFARARLVAEATIKAIQVIFPDLTLALEDISVSKLGNHKVVITCLSAISIGESKSYAGVAIIQHDQDHAVVKSVLNAINRRLGAWRKKLISAELDT